MGMNMKISAKTAMIIVRELKSIIKYDLTFMDTSAHIIACTDESRIGSYHAAAQKMLDEHLSILVVNSDDEYEGTRKGVNTIIEIEGNVVAVVGVTGKQEEVEDFVHIIKRMTELLLIDEISQMQNQMKQAVKERFIHEWIFSTENWIANDFYSQGLDLGIDITLPRRVVVASCVKVDEATGQTVFVDLWEYVHSIVKDRFQIDSLTLWITNGYRIILLIPEKSDDAILYTLNGLRTTIAEKHNLDMYFGVDSEPTFSESIKEGYMRAEKALIASKTSPLHRISFYHNVSISLFLNEISHATKRAYLSKVFPQCTPEEIERWCQLLMVLYQNNGSINKTAEQLYMHKNTLQYKLQKLKRLSGFDPRALGETSVFYLAMLIWDSLRG